MKLLIKDCIGIYVTIDYLKKNGLDFALAWKLDDVQQAIKKHYDRAMTEQDNIVKKYGTLKGEGYEISKDKGGLFSDEVDRLMNIEIEADIKPIPFSELQGLKLNGATDINAFKKVVTR